MEWLPDITCDNIHVVWFCVITHISDSIAKTGQSLEPFEHFLPGIPRIVQPFQRPLAFPVHSESMTSMGLAPLRSGPLLMWRTLGLKIGSPHDLSKSHGFYWFLLVSTGLPWWSMMFLLVKHKKEVGRWEKSMQLHGGLWSLCPSDWKDSWRFHWFCFEI